ncbi:MAG: AAA family ATPase [Myxococcota bacterium]|nr:AAA family ATPase [Myxococcota bacterium]
MNESLPATLARSGIVGLDDVLGGGFPRGRLYLIQGNPGAGKTTLALQFLLEGAAQGETGLYVTLSETREELEAVARSHGISLEGLSLYELAPHADDLDPEAEQTVFPTAEVELTEAMSTILDEVARLKPSRVVFDSLSEIRLLAQGALRYRRQILALKQHFAGSGCTVLLLDDLTSEPGDQQLQSLAHGVVALEQLPQPYGTDRRRMRVTKLRGVAFRSGYHDLMIERGGIRVHPRMIAREHSTPHERDVVSSGLPALDSMLGGGIERGTSMLLLGPPGTGKSSICSQYVASAASRGDRGAIFTFEESCATLLARADALGSPLRRYIDEGLVTARQINPVELSPGQFVDAVRTSIERDGVRVLVIDSLNGYLNSMPEENYLISQLHELFAYLGQHGVVTLLTMAQHGLMGVNMTSPADASYLADSVLLLRYFESEGRVRKSIAVVKKRSGAHEDRIREFRLGSDGIQVGEPLSDFEGVLTGVPRYLGQRGPLMAKQAREATEP